MSTSNPNSTYASRKRRKPVQKSLKPPPPEGTKSNPSKRHRDRLNAELERLASLLPFPQDVISKLDKLSVLRLSVSYLRAKNFFNVSLESSYKVRGGNGLHGILKQPGEDLLEGELLLQVLNGFVLVITCDGSIFYVSSTIQDYLGFHQSDVIHQSVYDLIHTEDRSEFQHQLHWALNPTPSADTGDIVPAADSGFIQSVMYYNPEQLPPENSPFLERNFVCRLRCLLDNSSGFLAMNFQGRLKFLHGQNRKAKDGSVIPPQLALFAVATPLQPPSILEIRTKNFIFRTKHKLDFTPTGCDAKGRIVLGYTDAELCYRGTGYQFIHAADMLYCAENHIRMIKTGESGMTVFRLLTKKNRWAWVQANARLVYKHGRPEYIIATQRALSDEEGLEHFRKRNLKLPFSFATGEAVLYEATFPTPVADPMPLKAKGTIAECSSNKPSEQESLDPNSLLGAMLKQDESVYVCPPAPNKFVVETSFFNDSTQDLNDILFKNWDDILPSGQNDSEMQDQNPDTSDSKNNELLCFMKNLGITSEDLELIQQDEEFMQIDWDETGDITEVADEILSYVQASLNKKSDCMFSPYLEQKLASPNSSCMMQHLQHQEQQRHHQQQLCQKIKQMQVNGVYTDWTSSNIMQNYDHPNHQQQQYAYINEQVTAQNFDYKTELNQLQATCSQTFLPYSSGAPQMSQPPPLTHIDYPVKNFNNDGLNDFLQAVQQGPGPQDCGLSSSKNGIPSQTSYTGAMSMYQYIPDVPPGCINDINQMPFNPLTSGQQPFLSAFQNGIEGQNNEIYSKSFGILDGSVPPQPLNHHHQIDGRSYPDATSSGYL
ncbi:aryl hydrocarbon receptor-like [Polypterus senegalus]|uniref:aryl hydrocarbon receptor-like n=1 Tax=Polypterus senegalus TaxID=55291 RepID=UPI0019639068|nr:aryl hydrocarbon receptor-like [Polypterus senegalus]